MTGSVWAVFLFEWKRALTVPRMAWWVILAAFPIFIIALIRFVPDKKPPREVYAGFLFVLVPMLVSMLGTLLWTTPAISAELERRSWVYLAVRPHGSTAVLLGKYLAAIAWVIPPALIGLTIAVPIAVPLSRFDEAWELWWGIARLVFLSCPAYGAVYLLLGTIMPRRGMVLAVAYTLIFEFVVAFVPAVINTLTVQFRLRALFVRWCNIPIPENRPETMAFFSDAPSWHHVLILMLLSPILLAVSVAILRWSEFSSSAESDV